MDEVSDLLTAWEIPELIPTFTKNGITVQSLAALNLDDIKELVPLVGPRALFIRSWKALHDISVVQEQETQTTPPKTNSPNKTVSDTVSPKKTITDNLELMQLLKGNFEASSLIQYAGESLPHESSRNLLALLIAKHILKTNKNTPITGYIYGKWAREIKTLFPAERTTTYYIPACVTAQGATLQARGKLVSQVLNTRRKYQKLGVLDKRSQNHTNISAESVPSDNDNSVQESLSWLEQSSTPWSLVQSKWTETSERRKLFLKEPQCTIEGYIKKFPALQKPEGYTLLLNDFESLYIDQKDNLYLNFPLTKQKLIKLLYLKKSKDAYHSELLELSKAADEELTNLAAILSLPELINPNVVLVSSNGQNSAGPSGSKKVKTTNRRWKPSKAESREAFVAHIKDDSYLQVTLENRHQAVIQRGLTPQPYTAIIGPTLSTIKSYLVIINPNTFYYQRNILQSIDTCFKIIWALNAEYSSDSYGPWYFIQKSFYKLSSPHDKGSTSAESLMTDCDLTI